MDAVVSRVKAGVLAGRDVEKRERVVGPAAPAPREERVRGVGLAGDDQPAGAFQADAAALVPAHPSVRAALDQRVLRRQEVLRESLLDEVREVVSGLQSNADGVEPGEALHRIDDAPDRIPQVPGLVEDLEYLPAHLPVEVSLLALRDVGDHRKRPGEASAGRVERVPRKERPDLGTVLLPESALAGVGGPLSPALHLLLGVGPGIVGHEGERRLPEHLFRFVAEYLGHSRVHECRLEPRVDQPDPFVSRLDDLAIPLLAPAEGLRRALLHGDVPGRGEDPGDGALGVAVDGRVVFHRHRAAVPVPEVKLVVPDDPFAKDLDIPGPGLRGVGEIFREVAPDELLARDAGGSNGGPVHVADPSVDVDRHQRVEARLDQRPVVGHRVPELRRLLRDALVQHLEESLELVLRPLPLRDVGDHREGSGVGP